MILETIFTLAFRKAISIRRVIILLLLAAFPLAIVGIGVVNNTDWDAEDIQYLIQAFIVSTMLPLVALIIAAPVFADEIEDQTLTNLMLSPVPRWQIALPKIVAAVCIVAIPAAISTGICVILVIDQDTYTAAAVGAFGILVGSIAFVSLFAFVGTLTTRAVVFGIIYVFGFEALISTAVPGLKYVSISGLTLSIMEALDSDLVVRSLSGSNQLPPIEYSVIALLSVIILTNIATVWRLKRMDVH